MKVLMTADTVGGVWTYALELIKALRVYDVRVMLATMGAPLTREQWDEVRGIDNLWLAESRFKLEWMENPWRDVAKAGHWLLELESEWHPAVIHLNGYVHAALSFCAPVMVVGHSCVLSWWKAVKGEVAPAEWDRYRREVTQGLRSARHVVAPTMAMLNALHEHYGPFAASDVIYNGRSTDAFQPGVKKPLILAAGRLWDEAKNIKSLESVANNISWPVHIAGDNTHPDGGSASYSGIKILGKLSQHEIASWLAKTSIYVLPSRYEPFGLSILEAGLSGCALVLGDIPSLREVWDDAAMFVPPDDEDALREAISALIQDDKKRQMFSSRARTKALEYTPKRMAEKYVATYLYLIREHKIKSAASHLRYDNGSRRVT